MQFKSAATLRTIGLGVTVTQFTKIIICAQIIIIPSRPIVIANGCACDDRCINYKLRHYLAPIDRHVRRLRWLLFVLLTRLLPERAVLPVATVRLSNNDAHLYIIYCMFLCHDMWYIILNFKLELTRDRLRSFVRSFDFVRSFVRSFIHSFVCPSVRSSFVRSFVYSFVRSSIRPFVRSFIRSISFIRYSNVILLQFTRPIV